MACLFIGTRKLEVTWRILLLSSETYKAGLSYPIEIERSPAHCIRKAATQFVTGKGKQGFRWQAGGKNYPEARPHYFKNSDSGFKVFSTTKISSKLHMNYVFSLNWNNSLVLWQFFSSGFLVHSSVQILTTLSPVPRVYNKKKKKSSGKRQLLLVKTLTQLFFPRQQKLFH